MKRVLAVLLVLAMVFCMSACGKKEEAPSSKVSGTVVIRTSHKQADQDMFKEMFEKKYPDCTVEFIYGSIGDTMAAVEAAKDNPDTDVVLGGLQATDGSKYYDLFEQYTPSNQDELTVSDPNGYYGYYTTQVMAFIVNTDVLAELGLKPEDVQGYEDLLRPELKGHILHADPSAASSAWRELETMLAVYNGGTTDYYAQSAWDYVGKLMDNLDGKTTTKSADVTQKVIDGEYAVGLSYESTCVENVTKAKEAGKTNITMVYPKEGNTEVAFACAMVKNCKNPEAAKAVIDFTCSVEYLDARLDLLGASRGTNKGCKGSDLCPPSSELGLIPIDLEVFTAETKALLKQYADLWTSKYPN